MSLIELWLCPACFKVLLHWLSAAFLAVTLS